MRLTAVLVTTALLAGALAGMPSAQADPTALATLPDVTTPLGLTSFRDLVVDDVTDQVFVSGASAVAVTDLEGVVLGGVQDQPSASGLALSADGKTLYVAVTDGISVIDTASLTQTARWSTGASTCPTSLAVLGSALWYGYGCAGKEGNLGEIDLSAASPAAVGSKLPSGSFFGAPLLATSPGWSGHLLAGQTGTSPAVVDEVDVRGTPTIVSTTTSVGDDLQDLAVSADGTQALVATVSRHDVQYLSTGDLSSLSVVPLDTYNGPYPTSVASSATGFVASGSAAVGTVESVGSSLLRRFSLGTLTYLAHSTTVAPRGVAVDAGGLRLYAVTTDFTGQAVALHVLHGPALVPVVLAAAPTQQPTVGRPFTLHGSVGPPYLTLGHAAQITITRSGPDGVVVLPAVTTSSSGGFDLRETLPKRGDYSYALHFAGDDTYAPASLRQEVTAAGLAPTIAFTGSLLPQPYGTKRLVYVHVGAGRGGRVALYATPFHGAKVLLKNAPLNAHGDISVAYTPSRNTTITADFLGDDVYVPTSDRGVLQTYARIESTIDAAVGRQGSYYLVPHAKNPLYTGVISPHDLKQPAVIGYVDELVNGTWSSAGSVTLHLTPAGRFGLVLTGAHRAGERVRFHVLDEGAPDQVTSHTVSPMTYVVFT